MRIFIDIETCPTHDPATIAQIRANIRPPANYTKADTIATWLADKGEAAALEAIGKTALSAEDGSIFCISIALDDGEPVSFMRPPEEATDGPLLRMFLAHVNDVLEDSSTLNQATGELIHKPEPWWIGHNITGFDLPFIWRRLIVNEVATPFELPAPDMIRHGKNCFDTMTAWAGFRERVSLDRLCRCLGIQSPKTNDSGITGATAWQFWQRGELDAVADYNRVDVLACRSIFHRLEAVRARRAA